MYSVIENILKKNLRTDDKGWSSSFSFRKYLSPMLARFVLNDLQATRFGTRDIWNVHGSNLLEQ